MNSVELRWAIDHVIQLTSAEMNVVVEKLRCDAEMLSEETFLPITPQSMTSLLKPEVPTLRVDLSCNRTCCLLSANSHFHGTTTQICSTSFLQSTMSQKWAFKGIDTLATHANLELRRQIHHCKLLFNLSHDNINMQFRVYEQRINRQSHFDSGTASTIYKNNENLGGQTRLRERTSS